MGSATFLTAEQLDVVRLEINARYGIDAVELSPLGGELDANFKAVTLTNERYFVRITGHPVDYASVEWQNKVLMQLTHRSPSVKVPRLLAQHDGSIMSTFGPANAESVLRLTTWVEGTNIADLGATNAEVRHQIGQLAAEVIDSLTPLNENIDGEHSHHWMVTRSGDSLRATIDAVDDAPRRALVEAALELFDSVADQIEQLPRSVVHQDLHDFNLLAQLQADGKAEITGIVDFNDAVYTARLAEVAVAATYSTLRQEDAIEAFMQVVDGFASRKSLTDLELQLLYPLAVARLAVNASTWTARGKVGNTAYAEARMAATWPALEQLLSISREEAELRIRQACSEPAHKS